jgi:hypothetical protein
MAQGAVVKLEGGRQLRRRLRAIADGANDLKDANAQVAALVAAEAARAAPRRTGRLAGTLRGNRAASRAIVSAGRASVPYAGPIHWGWPARRITANPFVWDTAQRTQSTWLPIYSTALQRLLDKPAD